MWHNLHVHAQRVEISSNASLVSINRLLLLHLHLHFVYLPIEIRSHTRHIRFSVNGNFAIKIRFRLVSDAPTNVVWLNVFVVYVYFFSQFIYTKWSPAHRKKNKHLSFCLSYNLILNCPTVRTVLYAIVYRYMYLLLTLFPHVTDVDASHECYVYTRHHTLDVNWIYSSVSCRLFYPLSPSLSFSLLIL